MIMIWIRDSTNPSPVSHPLLFSSGRRHGPIFLQAGPIREIYSAPLCGVSADQENEQRSFDLGVPDSTADSDSIQITGRINW